MLALFMSYINNAKNVLPFDDDDDAVHLFAGVLLYSGIEYCKNLLCKIVLDWIVSKLW